MKVEFILKKPIKTRISTGRTVITGSKGLTDLKAEFHSVLIKFKRKERNQTFKTRMRGRGRYKNKRLLPYHAVSLK